MSVSSERMGRLESDIEWIKRKLDKIERKIDSIETKQSNIREKVALISGGVSILVTLLLKFVMGG